jgi:hypothetical protein
MNPHLLRCHRCARQFAESRHLLAHRCIEPAVAHGPDHRTAAVAPPTIERRRLKRAAPLSETGGA